MEMKTKKGYAEKNCSIAVKEVDTDSRIVKGYYGAFGNIDSDRDMGMKGMFSKSIQSHGPDSESNRKIHHLAFHDTTRIAGKIQVLKETDQGLYFETKMGTHTEGEDTLRMYKEGLITEHSYGFNYIPDRMELVESKADGEESYYKLHEVQLWEGSHVAFGANQNTPNLTGIKSQKDLNDILDTLSERTEKLVRAIKDGSYSEKYNQMFEVELRQIGNSYKALIHFEPIKVPSSGGNSSSHDDKKKQYLLKLLQ